MHLVGIDFEMANSRDGSLCGFGIAYPWGETVAGVLRLHPERGGRQERDRWHHISPAKTAAGNPPEVLYNLLKELPADTVLVAHDARIDKKALYAWFKMWDLEPLHFAWFDTLRIARREFGKHGKTGIAAMARRLKMSVRPHHAGDDALVALTIAQKYGWGAFKVDSSSLVV